jgi:hypothetical protein
MYDNLKSCVLTEGGLSSYFDITLGTRQWCMLSPFLFNMYLNEFTDMCKNANCQGVYINETFPNVIQLLYADDATQGADTVGRLQKQLETLSDYSKQWGLRVNTDKTKVVVFRNGGTIRENEKWFLDGKRLDIISNLFQIFGAHVFFPTCMVHGTENIGSTGW